MHIRDLAGKSVCILGFGREGRAMLKALEENAPGCEVTVADMDASVTLPKGSPHWLQVGEGWLKNLEKFDAIIKSPGIPPKASFEQVKDKITSSTQVFFDTIAPAGSLVIGVTGSKGKSTTASLIFSILKEAGKDVFLVGNIGEPAIAHLKEAKLNTIFVHELSSYQLMDLKTSPRIAVVTAFFPEHLDYHGSVEAYLAAKKRIACFQRKEDSVFFAEGSEGASLIAAESCGRRIPFSTDDAPLEIGDTHLIGRHNLNNIAAAFLVSQKLGVAKEIALKAIKEFTPLPHRLEKLGIFAGIEWVDDSISTTPESAIAALQALGDKVATIILGGQDRGYDFDELAKILASSHVRNALLFPESGKRIGLALRDQADHLALHEVASMRDAVSLARKCTPQGSICLLSPASPSYGLFKNFEDRGEQFEECIRSR